MKKWTLTILSLALALSLPSCGKKKSVKACDKKSACSVDTGIDLNSSKEFSFDDYDYTDQADDLDLEDETEIESSNAFLAANAEDAEEKEFAWIDADNQELKVVYFDFDKSSIREDQKAVIAQDLEKIKELVKDSEQAGIVATVVVEGHACHSAGTPSYNMALSEYRASIVGDIVTKELKKEGLTTAAVKVVGRGQEMPVVEGSREEQAPNRRVELHIIHA